MPVTEWLVAGHPDPLSVNRVAQTSVGVHGIAGVVGVETSNVVVVRPVSVTSTHAWELDFLPPLGVAGEGFLQTYTVWTCDGLAGGVD